MLMGRSSAQQLLPEVCNRSNLHLTLENNFRKKKKYMIPANGTNSVESIAT